MTKRSTKRALLMSALAISMCVSMLVGTTFAWFTDSGTSAGNTFHRWSTPANAKNRMSGTLSNGQKALKERNIWKSDCRNTDPE